MLLKARISLDYRHHRNRKQENDRGDGKDYEICGLGVRHRYRSCVFDALARYEKRTSTLPRRCWPQKPHPWRAPVFLRPRLDKFPDTKRLEPGDRFSDSPTVSELNSMNQQSLVAANRAFYDALCAARLEPPERVQHLAADIRAASGSAGAFGIVPVCAAPARSGTHFLDISAGNRATECSPAETPVRVEITRCRIGRRFGLVCALMSLSTPKTTNRCSELSRVLKDGACWFSRSPT